MPINNATRLKENSCPKYVVNMPHTTDTVQHKTQPLHYTQRTSELTLNLPDFKFSAATTFSSVATNTFLTVEVASR